MSLVVPTLELIKEVSSGQPDKYILKSRAEFATEDLIADGHGPIPTSQESNGEFGIDLKVVDNPNVSSGSGPYVVRHEVDLGDLSFATEPFVLNVEIKKGGVKKGKGHVRNREIIIYTK